MFRKMIYLMFVVVMSFGMFVTTNAAVTVVGSDTTTQSNWRTAAALESDNEYGTDGYVIYGLNTDDGVYSTPYDASSLIDSNDPGASHDSAISLPVYIGDISLADNTGGMWSGNGNFGQIEDPNDPNNALTNTPVIANGPDPYVFTMTRTTDEAFRLTVICANGDGQVPEWTITVDDGSSAKTSTVTAVESPNIVYLAFNVPKGDAPITVSTEADVVNGWITGFAFDSPITMVGVDTTTQSNWRTAAALESDGEYGTDGYVIYGLNEADSVWSGTYDASTLIDSNDPGASHDSALSLPAYIGDISLAEGTGRWSGSGNFGQIEVPNPVISANDPNDPNAVIPDPNNPLTNTPVIAWGPDPYVFTITRTTDAAFRLTVICATGDDQVPTWAITVDDGSGSSARTGTVTAAESPNIVYLMFKIPKGDTPITVSTEADVVDGWITGFAFDSAITVVGSDTTSQSGWRTAATLEPDGEYGTDGYVIYGLNAGDGVYHGSYDASTLFESADPGASHDSAISLPVYIGDISLADNSGGMWSGNGNFGQIEDPNDPNNALTNTPVIANSPDPYVFTMTRSMAAAFRLTVICATGDGQVPTWTITVDDGMGTTMGAVTALESPNIVYQMFEIPDGNTPITVSTEADVVNGWITGFAFDEEVGEEPDAQEEPEPGEATLPVPEDGAWVNATWTTLEWQPGPFAASHDIFVGVDFDSVSEATLDDVSLFAGNTLDSLFVAGLPGGAVPDGLVPGTTYYWRVDEVNEADAKVWTGDVWSFSTTDVGSDTTTQSNWRTAAALEPDNEYGTDGYVIYGLNTDDGVYSAPYDASSLIDSNDPGASHDSAISLPGYIGDISLADNTGGMWSGNGNFGQIEYPNDPNNTLTNTPVISNSPDPYVFTMTRSMAAAFRLTVICATGDGQVPTWTITMDDGSGAKTRTIKALASPNIVYQMFEIPHDSTPITVSVEADVVDGWITGFAFDSE